MQATKHITAAALAAVLSCGCAAKPFPDPHAPARAAAWVGSPSVALHVRWVRTNDVPQSEVRDGVCVLYMADRDEASLSVAERLIAKCLQAAPAVLVPAPANTVLLFWYWVDSPEAIARMRQALYPREVFRNSGYYYHPDSNGPCHVVTDINRNALGHELKHCIDGEFHVSIPSAFGRETVWKRK